MRQILTHRFIISYLTIFSFDNSYIMVSKSLYYYKTGTYLDILKNTPDIRKVYIQELKVWQSKQFSILRKFEKDLMDLQIYQDSSNR